MDNNEDYLDGLLDSISQAKTENEEMAVERGRSRARRDERRSRVRPDDDFMEASGLNSYRREQSRSRRGMRRRSEDDFVRSFEDELSMNDADELIRSFEDELRDNGDGEDFLGNSRRKRSRKQDADDDLFEGLDDGGEPEASEDSVLSDIAGIVSEAKRVASGDDEEPGADAVADPLGGTDEPDLSADTSAQEVPLMDESGDDVDLMDMLAGEGDGDLMDIGDLLASDEGETELADARDAFEEAAEGVAEGGDGAESTEASGEEGAEGEEEPKQNIIQKILGAITGIFKKKEGEASDEDDEDEDEEDEEENAEEGGETKEERKARLKKEKEEAKKKKKEEADAKKKAKEEEKKKKAEEKKKAQAAKAAKPKKQKPKKPKERSPKIPIPVMVVFILFSASVVASVQIMSNVLGYRSIVSSAERAYDKQDYRIAYQALAGNRNLDGDAKKLRNRAKLMAYMQTKRDEYLVCMDSGKQTESGLDRYSIRTNYQMALDSLIAGVYFYQINEEKANELGISEEYAEYGQSLEKELDQQFNLTVGDAVDLYRNNTRKDYTAALQRIIRQAGYEERY